MITCYQEPPEDRRHLAPYRIPKIDRGSTCNFVLHNFATSQLPTSQPLNIHLSATIPNRRVNCGPRAHVPRSKAIEENRERTRTLQTPLILPHLNKQNTPKPDTHTHVHAPRTENAHPPPVPLCGPIRKRSNRSRRRRGRDLARRDTIPRSVLPRVSRDSRRQSDSGTSSVHADVCADSVRDVAFGDGAEAGDYWAWDYSGGGRGCEDEDWVEMGMKGGVVCLLLRRKI